MFSRHFIWACTLLMVVFLLFLALNAHIVLAADEKPAAAAAPVVEVPPLEITKGSGGFSVHAVGVQADELFTKLAKAAGVGVIIDDTVGRREGDKYTCRKITVHMTNKPIHVIFENICTAYGLSHTLEGGIFMVSEGIPKNPSSYLMSDIDSVTTEYVLSSKAKSLLPEFLQAHVKVNEGQNAVILSAPTEVLAKFKEDINQFDVPAAQIMIDVIMVELTDSGAKDLGFDFLWSNAGREGTLSTSAGDLLFHTLGTLTKGFTTQLIALVEKRQARVHANPRIATVSGQTANIFVGRQKYLRQPVEMSGGGIANFIDAGIKLDMTPWTGGDGAIIAEIHPEVSVLSAPDPITGLPEKSTRRANTVVRVKDGDTIVIGGLSQTEMQSTRTKVPVLGDIPLVGSLFKGVSKTESKTELVILITPHILGKASDQ